MHTNRNIANTCKQGNTHHTHTCAHRHRHTHLHTYTRTTQTQMHTRIHIRTLTYINTHTVSCIHARTHTLHTYTHHEYIHAASYLPVFASLNNFMQLRKSLSKCKPIFILCYKYLKFMSLCSLYSVNLILCAIAINTLFCGTV